MSDPSLEKLPTHSHPPRADPAASQRGCNRRAPEFPGPICYSPTPRACGTPTQVIDSGIDESSCYFANDESGDHVPHGHYYEEWGINVPLTSSSFSSPTSDDDSDDSWGWPWASADHHTGSFYQVEEVFDGGDFTVYPDRRKVCETGVCAR